MNRYHSLARPKKISLIAIHILKHNENSMHQKVNQKAFTKPEISQFISGLGDASWTKYIARRFDQQCIDMSCLYDTFPMIGNPFPAGSHAIFEES